MTTNERNTEIISYFRKIITRIKNSTEKEYQSLESYERAKEILKQLIPHKYDGFRGIVMTAIGGMYIDKEYNPLENFYACNPRTIFEQGIYYVLQEFKIPTTKSPPLNVAKTVVKLDSAWVLGKKANTQIAASSAIDYIELLLEHRDSPKIYQTLVDFFFFSLENHARSVRSIIAEPVIFDTDSKINLAYKLINFSVNFPEGGAVPQMVIGKLIRHTVDGNNKHVMGEEASVFGTNTTSKKPADIWIEDNEGNVLSLYEITVKKIDYKRLDDSIDAIAQLHNIDQDINFICRLPIDIEPLELGDDIYSLCYKGQWFNFIDIADFIVNCIVLLSDNEIKQYFLEMKEFIDDINRKEKTKNGWNTIFS